MIYIKTQKNIIYKMKYLQSLNEYKSSKSKDAIFHEEESENIDDVILFINDDYRITDEWKTAVISALTDLPNKYKKNVYSSRIVWEKDANFKDEKERRKKGDKDLSYVCIRNVGVSWDNNDIPFLHEHFEKYGLDFDYVYTYKYISIKSGENLEKYYTNTTSKFNL